MQFVIRAVLALSIFAFLGPHHASALRPVSLTALDRTDAMQATQLAGRSPASALQWLRRARRVSEARLGADHRTVDVHFRDGAELVILPRSARLRSLLERHVRLQAPPSPASGRALVLEPFATELSLGDSAGQDEANMLSQAGFNVTIQRNGDVTVGTMETLANYSVVYILTHSGILPNGDAIVDTGEPSPDYPQQSPYATMYSEHSLLQSTVAGQSRPILYNAITSTFLQKYVGTFPNSSLVFINGCQVLNAPLFWQTLAAKNVSALLSWDNDAGSNEDVRASTFVFAHLVAGNSVASTIAAARAAGVATSVVDNVTAHLGFEGDGGETLSHALSGAVTTATSMPTVTVQPTAIPTPVPTAKPATAAGSTVKHKKKHRAKKHKRKPKKPAKSKKQG